MLLITGDNPAQGTLRQISSPILSENGASTLSSDEGHGDGYGQLDSSDYALTEKADDNNYAPAESFATAWEFLSDDSLPPLMSLFSKKNRSRSVDRDEPQELTEESVETPLDIRPLSPVEGSLWTGEFDIGSTELNAPDEAGHDEEGGFPDSEVAGSFDSDGVSLGSGDPVAEDAQETASWAALSDDMGPPAERTSDMENWVSPYDGMRDAIARINGPYV